MNHSCPWCKEPVQVNSLGTLIPHGSKECRDNYTKDVPRMMATGKNAKEVFKNAEEEE